MTKTELARVQEIIKRHCSHIRNPMTFLKICEGFEECKYSAELMLQHLLRYSVEAARKLDMATDWIHSESYCPCCQGLEKCADNCTFEIDAPQEYKRITEFREMLANL